jgi:hypothetical protein
MYGYRNNHVPVYTGVYGMCASSCVTLFAMGTNKVIWGDDSEISVHTMHEVDETPHERQETANTAAASVNWARFLQQSGAPDSVLGKLVANGTGDTTPLTHDELAAWHVDFYAAPAK